MVNINIRIIFYSIQSILYLGFFLILNISIFNILLFLIVSLITLFLYEYISMSNIKDIFNIITKKYVRFWLFFNKNLELVTYDKNLEFYYDSKNFIKILVKHLKQSKKITANNLNNPDFSKVFQNEVFKIIKINSYYLILSCELSKNEVVFNSYRKIINHDLPSLFLSIKSKINKTQNYELNSNLQKEFDELLIISERLNFLFRGIITIYRNNKVHYEYTSFNFILNKTLLFLQENYNLQKVVILNKCYFESFYIDSNLLLIIIYNLLKNCLDHNPYKENLIITIYNYYDEFYKGFTIQDNGQGSGEKYLNNLLKENYKSQNSTGLGYGLSLVHDILSLYQGKVIIKDDNDGFKVTALLPKINEQ